MKNLEQSNEAIAQECSEYKDRMVMIDVKHD